MNALIMAFAGALAGAGLLLMLRGVLGQTVSLT